MSEAHDMAAIYATLTRLFREIFRTPSITLEAGSTSHSIAGWDSFKWVQIIVALETEYGIELDGEDIDEVRNVGDLANLIVRKLGVR